YDDDVGSETRCVGGAVSDVTGRVGERRDAGHLFHPQVAAFDHQADRRVELTGALGGHRDAVRVRADGTVEMVGLLRVKRVPFAGEAPERTAGRDGGAVVRLKTGGRLAEI